ncbi:hypothetical protein J3R82DRAFT_6664, partial [Butyriboletus roseoflavus]
LTKTSFISHCNHVWMTHGFSNMPGHAFSISGTTKLLLQGVNPNVISIQGHWSFHTFLEYWHHIETILPPFI